ncbi:MAG: HEAT repeat domain-containing protein [Candidatus Entotheonellia bacterium]
MRTMTWFLLAAMLLTNTIGLAYADQLRPLINDLKSADTTTVLKAIRGLGESGDIRAVPPLLEALRDKRGVVRQYTVEALQHLVQALDDGYIVVKRWLQSLINQLRLDPADDMITVEQSVVYPLGKAALGVNGGSKTCA